VKLSNIVIVSSICFILIVLREVLRKTNYYKKHLRLEKLHISDQKTDGDLTRS